MKLLALITGGRNGSSLFLSLLDGHSQIMQFPGTFLLVISLPDATVYAACSE